MAKLVLLLCALYLPARLTNAQPDSDPALTELSWNEFYTLQWDDFQGLPDRRSLGDAGTAVAIRAKPFLVRKKVNYDVVAIFSRSKSWVRDKSPSLLAHEQLHFDIAELYARKIRKRIKELNDQGVNEIDAYNEAIHKLLLESNEADERYDLETLHGALSKKQGTWSKNVKAELASLNKYKKQRRVIGGS